MVITGLSQDSDTSALRGALTAAGLDLECLQVVSPEDLEEDLIDESGGLAGEDLLLGDPGTEVPGINDPMGRRHFFRTETVVEAIGDLGIPESEIDNYCEALERGKTVVAFFAKPDTLDKATEVFKGSSLVNVRQY